MSIISPEELLIVKLLDYYSNPTNIDIFISIVEQGTSISLRLLDWFSTNYSKLNRIYINKIDVHTDYKNKLNGYKKKCFDPFCRKQRIFIYTEDNRKIRNSKSKEPFKLSYKYIDDHEKFIPTDNGIVTTVGQLNFFKWCMEKNIIGYIVNNLNTIETSMTEMSMNRKKQIDKKRKIPNNVHKTIMRVTVKFD